jgi:ribosomal protein L34E
VHYQLQEGKLCLREQLDCLRYISTFRIDPELVGVPPAARAAWSVDGRPHDRRLAKAEQARVSRPVFLHGTLVPTCAEYVTAQQVKAKSTRPAPRDVGAALCAVVTKETMLHAARTSFRHEAQVGRGVASHLHPLAASASSHPTHLRSVPR